MGKRKTRAEELHLITEEMGYGNIDREYVGMGKRVVNHWTVVWEEEMPIQSHGSRYWFALMKDKDGEEAFRILELDIRGIPHHIRVAKEEMFNFMVNLELWMHEFERMGDGQPAGRYGPIVVERHELPRLMRVKEEMIPGAKRFDDKTLAYCTGHLGARCDGKIHTCCLCGARCGFCYKNHEGYEYLGRR